MDKQWEAKGAIQVCMAHEQNKGYYCICPVGDTPCSVPHKFESSIQDRGSTDSRTGLRCMVKDKSTFPAYIPYNKRLLKTSGPYDTCSPKGERTNILYERKQYIYQSFLMVSTVNYIYLSCIQRGLHGMSVSCLTQFKICLMHDYC